VWTTTNRILRDRAGYDLGYRPPILGDVASGPADGRLVVLTGPRRVGKTVALLDTVALLCARPDIDPRQVLHVSCDGLLSRDLRRVITLGRALTRSVDEPSARPRIWLFDEISSVSGWTCILKAARDVTAFGDDTVVATGSRWNSTEDIHGNLLTGRAGTSAHHRIRQLMPMGFRDYLAVTRPALPLPPTMHPATLQDHCVAGSLQSLEFAVDEYDLAWQDYLTCGGFPRAVAEHHHRGAVSMSYLRDLASWLRADVDAEAPVDSVALLLAGIAKRMTSPVNTRRVAEELSYPSVNVFRRRLTRMINSHALLRCRHRRDDGTPVPGAQDKLYLADPLLAWLPAGLSPGLPSPAFTALTEMTLAIALAKAVEGHDEGRWVTEDTIGYLRTAAGKEVDFGPVRVSTTSGPGLTTPIESKWVDTNWRSEARTIEARFNGGILATKSILDLDHPTWAVPAPILAAMLG
jgi:predicted AAA+ superfamily ATPase